MTFYYTADWIVGVDCNDNKQNEDENYDPEEDDDNNDDKYNEDPDFNDEEAYDSNDQNESHELIAKSNWGIMPITLI